MSYGRLDDENPLSSILLFKAGAPVPWGFVEVPRTIVSITSFSRDPHSGAVFVAMSNEGDVYFVEGDVPFEKIPGAGVLSDDAGGLGSMRTIRNLAGVLYACGYGSQAYRRAADGRWDPVIPPSLSGLAKIDLSGMALARDGALAVCGATQLTYRTPTAEEMSTLERYKAEGPNSRFLKYRREIMRVEKWVAGNISFLDSAGWSIVDLGTRNKLNDICRSADGGVIAVGQAGVMFSVAPNGDVLDVSSDGIMQAYSAVRCHGSSIYVLGEDSIFEFAADMSLVQSISLPPNLTSPLSFDVFDDAIAYFDHSGAAIYADRSWTAVNIPDDLRQLTGR